MGPGVAVNISGAAYSPSSAQRVDAIFDELLLLVTIADDLHAFKIREAT